MGAVNDSARQLREHLARVGEAKGRRENVACDPGDSVEQTIRHSDAHLDAFGPGPDEDTAETWLRVRARLRALSYE